ncbi:kinase-like protein [Mytilinidion resinicola]|uniref:EKC/KEOPS complex subunit BUD32 n=1 Tax=Mytilinidion resinicola TaxID=574789 RepID=A0A6A6Z054_9PEZI|nr:kinase-like protein [Mytilinidion resinicola]KAF2813565.1 kinase-like protein [Mytilinidion resinicola]
MEEQTLPRYNQKHYYPVNIGDTFKDRYRIIAKLGFGAYSTVWLARDEKSKEYTSLKVCIQDDTETSPILNEIKMLRRLADVAKQPLKPGHDDHAGQLFTRFARDIFEIQGPTGRHHCIAMKPQGNSVRTLQERSADGKLPKLLVRSIIHRLWFSINWLHAGCGVVHTDITPKNVLMESRDDTIFKDIEDEESREPSVPIVTDRGPVYPHRPSKLELSGIPILSDFGSMRLLEPMSTDWWMPDLYRAPEVLLKLPWEGHVDYWSMGVMTLELLEAKNLFDPIDRVDHRYVLPIALAQYIGYLGPPPLEMIKQSPLFSEYFDADGNWAYDYPIPKTSLEEFVTVIPPGEEKDLFLKYIRKQLTWDPEARVGSADIIFDDWLMRPNEIMGPAFPSMAESDPIS